MQIDDALEEMKMRLSILADQAVDADATNEYFALLFRAMNFAADILGDPEEKWHAAVDPRESPLSEHSCPHALIDFESKQLTDSVIDSEPIRIPVSTA
jgi:hypothetical protein